MLDRPWTKQVVWLVAAGVLLTGAGLLQGTLDGLREEHELIAPGDEVAQRYPLTSVLTLSLGGLRAPVVACLWIRSENLKQAGRHFDALQTAQMICRMMPRFPGVWDYHAWNLAWNISVQTHTGEERWQWVQNGIRLLRDEGIPLNPKALVLYKQLSWIFFSKMGQTTDEMHGVYKQRWAAKMQRLLAAPPYGTTEEALAAFRPVAEAPLDKTRAPTGEYGDPLQQAVFVKFLRDEPDVARYVGRLGPLLTTDKDRRESRRLDQIIGHRLLDAYNQFSLDDALAVVRVARPRPDNDRERALSVLINSDPHAEVRRHLLGLVRAHILWNRYRMDPAWMMGLMEQYGPMDWREVFPHGMYWASYGVYISQGVELKDLEEASLETDIDSLNNYRNWLYCMKNLAWNGRLTYIENPRDPNSPRISWFSDWRFVLAAHEVHDRIIKAYLRTKGGAYKDNILKDGHINYLAAAIGMLYAGYRYQQAERLFDWTKETYQPQGGEWKLPLREFVAERLNKDGSPIPDYARNQMLASLHMAFYFLAHNKRSDYQDCMRYALLVYTKFQENAPKRIKMRPFDELQAYVARDVLGAPRLVGFNLLLEARMRLYASLPDNLKLMLYDAIRPPLVRECDRYDLDFAKAFPPPDGLNEYRRRRGRRIAPLGP